MVTVTRRPEIADPQGTTAARALRQLGFDEVTGVRIDRLITLEMDGDDDAAASIRVAQMCDRFLANPVIEDYQVKVDETQEESG